MEKDFFLRFMKERGSSLLKQRGPMLLRTWWCSVLLLPLAGCATLRPWCCLHSGMTPGFLTLTSGLLIAIPNCKWDPAATNPFSIIGIVQRPASLAWARYQKFEKRLLSISNNYLLKKWLTYIRIGVF